jgi:hypothetical protein
MIKVKKLKDKKLNKKSPLKSAINLLLFYHESNQKLISNTSKKKFVVAINILMNFN